MSYQTIVKCPHCDEQHIRVVAILSFFPHPQMTCCACGNQFLAEDHIVKYRRMINGNWSQRWIGV